MLEILDTSLHELISQRSKKYSDIDRLEQFIHSGPKEFTRNVYLKMFKTISTATASRDIKKGVEMGWFKKTGQLNKTKYIVVKKK